MLISEFACRDHSKGADRRQRPDLRPPQQVLLVPDPHVLSFDSTRQVQPLREHVARIDLAFITRIRAGWLAGIGRARVVMIQHGGHRLDALK